VTTATQAASDVPAARPGHGSGRAAPGRLLRQRLREDAGMASVWMLFTGFIAILVAAVIFAGGVVFGACTHGYDLAQQAARAGAQHIDLVTYRTSGVLRLNPAQAATAARQFLAAAGATGTVTVTLARITVTATSRQPTPMLSPFGVAAVTVTATATATPVSEPPT
jgi:hypothetical protein